MLRKRKRTTTPATTTFSVSPGELSNNKARVVVQRLEGRRVLRETAVVAPPDPSLPVSCNTTDIHQLLGANVDIDALEQSAETYTHQIGPSDARRAWAAKTGQFATTEHDKVLTEWVRLGFRELCLSEMLRLEGWRGQSRDICPGCPEGASSTPSILCRDCNQDNVICIQCCLQTHAAQPFHRVRMWNGSFFQSSTLQSLGLVVQVGHSSRARCSNPVLGPQSFMVIDTTGFHGVTVQFCECSQVYRAGGRYEQLLRAQLFPATMTDPSTCCTFRALEQFHILTLQSKISAYDYYITLSKLTDNVGLSKHIDRLKPFLRMVREWRHLKQLKRAGRGHYSDGVKTTGPADLCVPCPACPVPGFNLPDNWETISDDLKYIYSMVIAFDANFRLRRRAISSNDRDPALGSGWGYFVEDHAYREHIAQYVDQEDISTCTGLAALTQANTRFTKGLATTGVAMGVDARHGFILGNSAGDLQKGERQCNLTYIFASVLKQTHGLQRRTLSYDIMCQFAVHLGSRLQELPDHLRIELAQEGDLRYAIPKFHLRAHKTKDHNQYSLNLMPGVGRSDGEEIERNWARHNAAATSTREMGPGSRHDTLEDHFGYANWQKFTGLGIALKRRLREAAVEKVAQDRIYEDFTRELQPENVTAWLDQVTAFEADVSAPDPYYISDSGLSEAEIRLQLAEEENATEPDIAHLHEMSASSMLISLLELEDQQRRFKVSYLKKEGTTPLQTAEVIEKRRGLRRRIANIRIVQAVYMPMVPLLLARRQISGRLQSSERTSTSGGEYAEDLAEDQPLFLPSQLSTEHRSQCVAGIAAIEERLRDGQLRASLDKLRTQLHVKSRMMTHKDRNVRAQRPNTRARQKLSTNDTKIRACAAKYRDARKAKLALGGPGPWEERWRELRDLDIRTLKSEVDIPAGEVAQPQHEAPRIAEESEGRRKLSWIWMGADGENIDHVSGLNSALRVEFLKSRARAHRFMEEIRLIQEEQRRTLVSLEKYAQQWDARANGSHENDAVKREGLAAYSARQSSQLRALAVKFSDMWKCALSVSSGDTAIDPGGEPDSDAEPTPLVLPSYPESDSDCDLPRDGSSSESEGD